MKIGECFPSKYVAAEDLAGHEVDVVIERVVVEEIDDDTAKPVVHFVGMRKGLVLNKTNATTIAGLYGEETDEWPGKAIRLYPTETDYRGKQVRCIRVRLDAPPDNGKAAPTPPQPVPAGSAKVSF